MKSVYWVTVAKGVDRLVSGIVMTLLIGMIITTSAGVLWRYGFNSALSWSEELSRFLLVWVSFLGAAMATYRGSHIGIAVVFDRLPARARLWVGRIVDVMVICYMVAVLAGGIKMLPFVHVRVAATLPFHMNVPYLVMPVSAGLIIFYMLVHLLAGTGQPEEPS